MRKVLLLGFVLLFNPMAANGLDWVYFTVTRHVNTTGFTSENFDAAMNEANDLVKYDHHSCADDVPCTVRFVRSGALGTFGNATDGLDVITTQSELDDVFDVSTHRIKVVDVIDYCAGGFNPSIIGCGINDGFGIILESWVGGGVYVHEYGHNVDLEHRDDCADNIMNSHVSGCNSIDITECLALGGRVYTQLCGNLYDGVGGPLTANGGPYWVTCNVTVPAGETLTIQAGVECQFELGLSLKSNGYTTADGSTGRITIYSNNQTKNYPEAIVDHELIIQNGGELIFD